MTNHIALTLALLIAGFLLIDWLAYEGAGVLFLMIKLTYLIEYVAIWR